MAIDYVEIKNTDFKTIDIIDTFDSLIWHSVFFGVGDFELYTKATPKALQLLKEDFYVTRPDDIEIGIIEHIEIADNEQDGTMIVAKGRFAKSILDRRLIYNLSGTVNKATILYGNVEENVRSLVEDNAINCVFDTKRNFEQLELGESSNIPIVIMDGNGNRTRKQVSYANLLTYTDGVLEEYGLASIVTLSQISNKLQYFIYNGIDRSIDNVNGNIPIVFSKEYDNLTSSAYYYDKTLYKNVALIGGAGEGVERFYSILDGTEKDMQRREVFIDASAIERTYQDENETEQTYSDTEYTEMLHSKGTQDMSTLVITETFSGEIDITNGNWVYNRDFTLGDIVTVQENKINKYINVRICEILEKQDKDGYAIEAVYKS